MWNIGMKYVTYWYQLFICCEELVPIYHGVKFAKCEIWGSTMLALNTTIQNMAIWIWMVLNFLHQSLTFWKKSNKLNSEIVWHRFFSVPAFICRFRSRIAVRKFFLKASPYFSSRFHGSLYFWQSPDILGKTHNSETRPQTKSSWRW